MSSPTYEQVKRWRHAHPEKAAEINRTNVAKHYERNREAVLERNRQRYRRKKGIPADWPRGRHYKPSAP